MCDQHRRQFIGRLAKGGLLLTPLAAALSGCTDDKWPEGMKSIIWDRDTCVRCNMAISDRRFAAELRGGPKDTVFKFDDPGCLELVERLCSLVAIVEHGRIRASGTIEELRNAAGLESSAPFEDVFLAWLEERGSAAQDLEWLSSPSS